MNNKQNVTDFSANISSTLAKRCIVEGEHFAKDEMIRFVVSPEGVLTPDICGKLPGRGIWIHADSDALSKVLKSGKFISRKAGRNVHINQALPNVVKTLLQNHIKELFGLALKSDAIILGFEKSETYLEKNSALGFLISDEASIQSIKKLTENKHYNNDCEVLRLPVLLLSSLTDVKNCNCVLIKQSPLGQKLQKEIKRMMLFGSFTVNGAKQNNLNERLD